MKKFDVSKIKMVFDCKKKMNKSLRGSVENTEKITS